MSMPSACIILNFNFISQTVHGPNSMALTSKDKNEDHWPLGNANCGGIKYQDQI
jgi:hypothetical protein